MLLLEEKYSNKSYLKKLVSKLNDHIKIRDDVSNIRMELEEKVSELREKAEKEEKMEKEEKEEKVEEVEKAEKKEIEEILSKAENVLKSLDKQIEAINDAIKKERSILESLRVLTWIRKISSIVGGFLLFFGGILLTLSILMVTKILIVPETLPVQLFFGYLLLIISIVMLLSGTIHQVV